MLDDRDAGDGFQLPSLALRLLASLFAEASVILSAARTSALIFLGVPAGRSAGRLCDQVHFYLGWRAIVTLSLRTPKRRAAS